MHLKPKAGSSCPGCKGKKHLVPHEPGGFPPCPTCPPTREADGAVQPSSSVPMPYCSSPPSQPGGQLTLLSTWQLIPLSAWQLTSHSAWQPEAARRSTRSTKRLGAPSCTRAPFCSASALKFTSVPHTLQAGSTHVCLSALCLH